ncbi:TraM recognition domain-containing protein [Clavibacter sp. VKM Ac-2873]|uniref:TraM recognition domain-containing protein n=1 Tax=Clavibacter sp. VKM Ac-2873 TaxID=2783813 RepID=UPI001E3507BE|nr:TraM recognition domain-containing protein [Clavibacter sp. VKM Ac-2873]
MSVFQSWSQGVAVFGKEGMLKLFSASDVFAYLGGVRENDFSQHTAAALQAAAGGALRARPATTGDLRRRRVPTPGLRRRPATL